MFALQDEMAENLNQNVISLSSHQYIVKFYKQPPSHLRKSNFFSFKLVMHDLENQPIALENAQFVDFIDTTEEDKTYSNGLIYKFDMLFRRGDNTEERVENKLFVRLVDSQTKELVPFEGITKNPDMKRVLVTHEVICSRCSQNKSCGNKMCTPSDPVITDKYYMQVYAKCNQNCVKIAGNPRDSRRFRVAIYCPTMLGGIDTNCVALSDPMFVHNNSKYRSEVRPVTTKPPRLLRVDQDSKNLKPRIVAVFPSEGWTGCGKDICVIGESFNSEMKLIIGSQQVPCEFISSNALRVTVPRRSIPGEVYITLFANGEHYCTESPGIYKYLAMDVPSMDDAIEKLGDLLNISSKEMILQKAIEFIESAQVRSGALLPNSHTAFNFPPPTTSNAMSFGSPSEYSTATVPTPGDSAGNSSAVFGSYMCPRRNSIRESSPTMHVERESPNFEMPQQTCNPVLAGSEPSLRRMSSVTGSDENLYVLSREPSDGLPHQQESSTRYNAQYKVPPPLQLAPAMLNHVYSDIPPNVSLACNNSEFMECQSQQPPQPVPCAVIITPNTTPSHSQQTPTVNRSTDPPLQPASQVEVVDSPMLPQISLSPSVFARMMNNQDSHEPTTHHSAANDNLSMTYLPSPGLVTMGTNSLNGISPPQMAPYLHSSTNNIASQIQRIALPFEHYIATAPVPSPGMTLTFPPPTPTALLAPINMTTTSCRFPD